MFIMAKQTDFLVSMENVSKTYPNGVAANKNVDFYVKPGEIHGLLGENGAGKTTLMKILYGLESKDSGTITLDGIKKAFRSPDEAIRSGIGMVHQHFRLAPSFSVAQNVVLGREPRKGLMFDNKRATEVTRKLAEDNGFDINVEDIVGKLSVGKRQFVEILRLLYQGAEILIFDEPTAVLTPQETMDLMESMSELAEEGHTIIFITHKIERALGVSDVLSVMRDGEITAERVDTDRSEKEVSKLMVGREVSLSIKKELLHRGEAVLEANNLSTRNEDEVKVVKEVSFALYEGEILGIAAVQGNGQSELVETLFGLRRKTGGEIVFRGQPIQSLDPANLRELGISFIPEDRMEIGVAADATVTENLTLPYANDSSYRWMGFLKKGKLTRKTGQLIDQFDIKVSDTNSTVGSLSGGNVQKLLLAREFSQEPKLLLAAQPTRGLDIGTRRFVWDELLERRSNGSAILLISSDLTEVTELSDRIMVMYEGQIVGIFEHPEEVSDEEIGLYMMGAKQQKKFREGG